jgi:hypothetical protein
LCWGLLQKYFNLQETGSCSSAAKSAERFMMGEDSKTLQLLREALAAMKAAKPNDRSEADRYAAIAITDLEKLIAFYVVCVGAG